MLLGICIKLNLYVAVKFCTHEKRSGILLMGVQDHSHTHYCSWCEIESGY